MKIQFFYYADCPSHEEALARLKAGMAEEGIHTEIEITEVITEEQAIRYHFTGSPTILINGQDIVPPPTGAQYALTCRAYQKADGRISPLPPVEVIRAALRGN